MNQIDNLEKRLSAIEAILNVQHDETPATGPDPYLVPGAPCEVTFGTRHLLRYFSSFSHEEGYPAFCESDKDIGEPIHEAPFSHYRVLGTVWDHAPDWAEWVATDANGDRKFFRTRPSIAPYGWASIGEFWGAGYTSPSDWQNSLRRRPEWARRKG